MCTLPFCGMDGAKTQDRSNHILQKKKEISSVEKGCLGIQHTFSNQKYMVALVKGNGRLGPPSRHFTGGLE